MKLKRTSRKTGLVLTRTERKLGGTERNCKELELTLRAGIRRIKKELIVELVS